MEDEPIAVTRVHSGTDINFGALTKQMIDYLISLDGVELSMQTKVTDIDRESDGEWKIAVDSYDEGNLNFSTNFVFIGASNELGEFRAGTMAAFIGTVPAVLFGGVGAMAIAVGWAFLFPQLLKVKTLDNREISD